MMQPFTIPITNNSIVERVETSILSVTTCGVTIGSVSSTEVRITDDSKWNIFYDCYIRDQQEQQCHWANHNIQYQKVVLH